MGTVEITLQEGSRLDVSGFCHMSPPLWVMSWKFTLAVLHIPVPDGQCMGKLGTL